MTHRRATPTQRRLLAGLLFAAAVLQGVWAWRFVHSDPRRMRNGDTASYVQPAIALLDHHRFTTDSGSGTTVPDILRTPGYPLLVAATFGAFGHDLVAVVMVQVVLHTLLLLLVYLLGARVWSATLGLVAACVVALEPSQLVAMTKVLTENLATVLLLAVVLLGFDLLAAPSVSWRRAALLGLAITASTYVRPVTYYLPLLVLAALVARCWCDRTPHVRRAAAVGAVAMCVPVLVGYGAWQYRNHWVAGTATFSGVDGKNLLMFRGAGVLADVRGVSFDRVVRELRAELEARSPGDDPGRRYDEMRSRGIAVLRAHPVSALKVTALGFATELTSTHMTWELLDVDVPEVPAHLGLFALYGAAVVGFAAVVRRRRQRLAHLFVAVVVLYVVGASAGPEAYGGRGERFRAPVMPLLVVYAAVGVAFLWRRWRAHSRAASAGVVGAVGAGADEIEPVAAGSELGP